MDKMDDLDTKLSEPKAAELYGVTRQTLAWRRKHSEKSGRPCVPPFIMENGRAFYRESDVLAAKADMLQAKADGLLRPKWPRLKPKRPAGHVSQRQAAILLDLPKGVLDHDHRNGRTIPVSGSLSLPFYPLDGIKTQLKGKVDRLLTFNQTVRALATTPERLADHVTNVRAGFPTMLDLPFEEAPSGAMEAVGFRLSAVIKAAEVLFQHGEE